jgi:hypothetical protein
MALCFALGSACFVIGPFPGYASLVGDSADAITFFVGSILFTIAYALGALQVPHFGRPDIAQFGWTIVLAVAVALIARVIMAGGLATHRVVTRRAMLALPVAGLIVAGLAISFHATSGRGVDEVLFSGQSALPGLVANAGSWSLGALALLITFKGLAYCVSLGSFRGGPHLPRAVSRRGRRGDGFEASGIRADPRRGGGHGCGDCCCPQASPVGRDAGHPAHRQRGRRGWAADPRRRSRRLCRVAGASHDTAGQGRVSGS